MKIKKILVESINHPRKILNALGLKAVEKLKPIKTSFYPSFIVVEPTINCNLNCVTCQKNTLSRKNSSMNFENFKKLIDKMPSIRVINLQGFGEPFMCKDFFKMVDYATRKGIRVYTFSNANLITPEIAKKIVNSNLSELIISIDGATKKTYELIRRGANWEIFIRNIKYLMSLRNPKKIKINAWIVPSTLNFNELEDIVKLAKELGFDKTNIQSKLSVYSFKKDFYKKIKKISLNNDNNLKRKITEIKNKYSNVEVCEEKEMSPKRQCKWPWTSFFVSSDGDIVPCCVLSDPKIANFGNIFNSDIKEIWNGQKYQELRKRIKTNNLPYYCKDCYGKN